MTFNYVTSITKVTTNIATKFQRKAPNSEKTDKITRIKWRNPAAANISRKR